MYDVSENLVHQVIYKVQQQSNYEIKKDVPFFYKGYI